MDCIPGVHIETIHNPIRYTYAQIEQACRVAAAAGARQAHPSRVSEALAAGDHDPDGEGGSPPGLRTARELDGERRTRIGR